MYEIKFGDTISKIISTMYGIPYSSHKFNWALEYTMELNKHIKDPNRIQPGDLLLLEYPLIPGCKVSNPLVLKQAIDTAKRVPKFNRKVMEHNSHLNWSQHLVGVGRRMNFVSGVASQFKVFAERNRKTFVDMSKNWNEYAKGDISKYQYNKSRLKFQGRLNFWAQDKIKSSRVNPYQASQARKALAKAPNKSVHMFSKQIAKQSHIISKLAKFPYIGLVVDIGITTYNASQKDNWVDRGEEIVAGGAGMALAGAFTLAAGAVLAGIALSPAGIVIAVIFVGLGAVLFSEGGSRAGRWMYKQFSEELDRQTGQPGHQILHLEEIPNHNLKPLNMNFNNQLM